MINGIKKILPLIGLLMVMILSGCPPPPDPDNPTPPAPVARVVLSPADGTVKPGETFMRTINAENVGNTFYVGFDLTYDASVVEYLDATEGSFLNKNRSNSTSLQNALVNGTQGRVAVGLTRLGPIGDVSGSGMLLTLTFKAVGPGITRLAFQHPRGLKNSDNQDVTSSWEDGTVTVQ